ncbi:MAG: hypothetical protein WB392_03835 [Methanotrichaceae archaeon]
MKTIILLLAVLAMVGFAAAWDTTEQMQYAYQKTVNEQANQNLDWLSSATSSAQSSSQTGYGPSNTYVSNGVTAIVAPLQNVATGSLSTAPDTSNSITQSGSAEVTTSAPDLQNPAGIKFAGTASTSELVSLSGNYGNPCGGVAAEALLTQKADVGVGGVNVAGITNNPAWNPDNWPETTTSSENPMTGMVETSWNTNVVEASIGASTTSGLQQIQAEGALPTMSGSSSSYAGFSGAYSTNSGYMPQVETSVAGSTGFGMFNTFSGATGFSGTWV